MRGIDPTGERLTARLGQASRDAPNPAHQREDTMDLYASLADATTVTASPARSGIAHFRAVDGDDPYPWQRRYYAHLVEGIRVHPLPNAGVRYADGRIRRVLLTAAHGVDAEA